MFVLFFVSQDSTRMFSYQSRLNIRRANIRLIKHAIYRDNGTYVNLLPQIINYHNQTNATASSKVYDHFNFATIVEDY